MSRVLITGASGFVGRALTLELAGRGYVVRAATRAPESAAFRNTNIERVRLPDLSEPIDWAPFLDGVDAVVHLAGIAHIDRPSEAAVDRINRAATTELAAAAALSGLRRFVFVSSVAAQIGSASSHIVTEADKPCPTTAYGRAKLAAETAVRNTGVPYAILRPVLVCGPGASGNLAKLMKLAEWPVPLPLGAFENRRSLVGIDNLTAAISLVLESPAALGETFLVADPVPLTPREIITVLRQAKGRSPSFVRVHPALIERTLKLIGRGAMWDRIGGSLIVASNKLIAAGWQPTTDTRATLTAMVLANSPAAGITTALRTSLRTSR